MVGSDACGPAGPAAFPSVHERTFLAVKPDGVQRRLVGEIVRRFERKGFKLVALKLLQVRAAAGVAAGRQWAWEGRGPRARSLTPSLPRPRKSCCASITWNCVSAPFTAAWSSTWAQGRWWPW